MPTDSLVQTGAVGIAIALILLIGKVWLDSNKWVERFLEAFEKNTEVNAKVIETIDKTNRKTDENTKILAEHRKFLENLNGKLEKAIKDRLT